MAVKTPREVALLVMAANELSGIYDPSNREDLLALLMHAARIAAAEQKRSQDE